MARAAKPKITAKKWNGDDAYSWCVFLNGRPIYSGLTRPEIAYYKNLVKTLVDKGTLKV